MNRRDFLMVVGTVAISGVVGKVSAIQEPFIPYLMHWHSTPIDETIEDRAIRLARLAQDHQDELDAIDAEAVASLREMEIRAHGLEEVRRREQELEALWDEFWGHVPELLEGVA